MEHPLVRPTLAPYGFAFPYAAKRLEFRSQEQAAHRNFESEIAKLWEEMHRSGPEPLPIQSIIHEILPGNARANHLRSGDFIFRGLPYLSRDIALLSTIIYWFGTNIGNCFLEEQIFPKPSGRRGHPEREFIFKFESEMKRNNLVLMWTHICVPECGGISLSPFSQAHHYNTETVTARDYVVAKGLMQWLGRKQGRKFITTWLAQRKQQKKQKR